MTLSEQMQRRTAPATEEKKATPADKTIPVVSTGSTLLDLAISGGRFKNGGLPGGILVEIFGPSASGKTVLLSEIAGNVQRKGGDVRFMDPEGRLNKEFAKLFGLNVEDITYDQPDTVAELFAPLKEWEPKGDAAIHGVFADSLAALSTEWAEEGKDNYGMRRAKEFSEQLRMMCRVLVDKDILMVCSNQIRQNLDAGPYGQKYKSPGGEAIAFYSSVRLRTTNAQKLKKKKKVRGKEHEIVVGVETEVEVFKNSVWAPYHKAKLMIDFKYGIDDVKANLDYIKQNTGAKVYQLDGQDLHQSLDRSAEIVEEQKNERKLKKEVIELWNEIESAFESKRIKHRAD